MASLIDATLTLLPSLPLTQSRWTPLGEGADVLAWGRCGEIAIVMVARVDLLTKPSRPA
jgi:hypothetical protein